MGRIHRREFPARRTRSGPGGLVYNFLGQIPLSQGDAGRADDLFLKGLSESRRSSDRFIISPYDLALSRRPQADLAGAADLLNEGLSLAAGAGDDASVAYYLARLAEAAGEQDFPERAVRLRAAADVLLQATGSGWPRAYVPPVSPAADLSGKLRSSLGETAFARAQAEGGEMEVSRVVEYALEEEQPRTPARS